MGSEQYKRLSERPEFADRPLIRTTAGHLHELFHPREGVTIDDKVRELSRVRLAFIHQVLGEGRPLLEDDFKAIEDRLVEVETRVTGSDGGPAAYLRATDDRISELDTSLAEAREEIEALRKQITVVGDKEAARRLGDALRARAGENAKAWKRSLSALGFAVLAAGCLALLSHSQLTPEAGTGKTVGDASLTAFLLGLAVYFVRLAGQSYRSQRQLQVTNLAKADALETFPLLAEVQPNDDARAAIAVIAAQYVFTGDEAFTESVEPSLAGTGVTVRPR